MGPLGSLRSKLLPRLKVPTHTSFIYLKVDQILLANIKPKRAAGLWSLCVECRRSLLRRELTLVLLWSWKSCGCRLTSLNPLILDHQGLSIAVRPPPSEPSRGFLGYEGASARRLMSKPWSPVPTGVGEAVCPVVSRQLCDPIEEVADSTSRLLNGLVLWDLCTCRGLGCPVDWPSVGMSAPSLRV